jgi:hypothetical protein
MRRVMAAVDDMRPMATWRMSTSEGSRRKGKQDGRQDDHRQTDKAANPLMVQTNQHGTPPWPAGHRRLQPNASGWGRMVIVTRRFMASLLEIGLDSP